MQVRISDAGLRKLQLLALNCFARYAQRGRCRRALFLPPVPHARAQPTQNQVPKQVCSLVASPTVTAVSAHGSAR